MSLTRDQKFDSLQRIYLGVLRSDFLPYGTRTLRGGIRTYSPCVLDRKRWNEFFLTLPKDYDIKNDLIFNCHRSTYNRLMDVGAPVPQPTTQEMLQTGFCGQDETSLTRPAFLRSRENDKRPEPAFRHHLSDGTALHHLRGDPLEGIIEFGRTGDMNKVKSITKRDYKWRSCCPTVSLPQETMDLKVHHFAKTDIHGRLVDQVVMFDDDWKESYFHQKLLKLKKAWLWPENRMTGDALGGHLLYHSHQPSTPCRHHLWPCSEKDTINCDRISIPEDRCKIFMQKPKSWNRLKARHFNQKSYLDMRYPIRNYECWEEIPACCGHKPSHFSSKCSFIKGQAHFPST